MPVTEYKYTKSTVDLERLENEIKLSSIVIALDRIDFLQPDQLSVFFKDALSATDKSTLDSLVTAHTGEPWVKPESPQVIIVEEEGFGDPNRKTGGHYQSSSIGIDVPAIAGVHTADFSFPIPISLLSASFVPEASMKGDLASFYIAPDTAIGFLSMDVTAGSDSINVDDNVISNLSVGYELSLFDGTKTNDMGRVLSISGNTVLCETKTVDSFLASNPTYVRMSIEFVRYFEIFGDKRLDFGSTKIGGSYIPANTILSLKYDNKSETAKRVVFMLEYLY